MARRPPARPGACPRCRRPRPHQLPPLHRFTSPAFCRLLTPSPTFYRLLPIPAASRPLPPQTLPLPPTTDRPLTLLASRPTDDAQGTFYHADGSRYEGEWATGRKEGKGTLFFANGDSYQVRDLHTHLPRSHRISTHYHIDLHLPSSPRAIGRRACSLGRASCSSTPSRRGTLPTCRPAVGETSNAPPVAGLSLARRWSSTSFAPDLFGARSSRGGA